MTNEKDYEKSKVDEDGVEYYAPEMGAPDALKIPDQETEDTDEFETKLDARVVFQRIAKDLYKYPTSAIRELIVNAIGHGARKANEKYGTKNGAYVDIHLHPSDRKLVITDVNGMGMSYQHIKNLMAFVGRSGNLDSKTAGQFGMGFFSFLKIAENCLVHSRVRDAYDYQGKQVKAFSFLNQGGWQWQKLNKTDEDVPLEKPGTQIRLTLNEDITIEQVIETIENVSRYQDVKVKLYLDGETENIAAGEYELEQFPDLKDVHGENPEQEVIELDDEDVYFRAVMYKDEWEGLSHDGAKVTLLANVPIDMDESFIPRFSGYVLNVKNERKFVPLPDRERLAVKSEEMLKEKLEKLFKSHFSNIVATNAEELDDVPMKYPVLFMRNLRITDYLQESTRQFVGMLLDHHVNTIRYEIGKDGKGNEVVVSTDNGADHNLNHVLAYRKNCIIVHNKNMSPIAAIHKWCLDNKKPVKSYIRITDKLSQVTKDLIEEWGIPKSKDFIKEHKIYVKSSGGRSGAVPEGIPMHYRDGRHEIVRASDLNDIEFSNTFWTKGKLTPWAKITSNKDGYDSGEYRFAKYLKSMNEWVEENEQGRLTVASLATLQDFKVYGQGEDGLVEEINMSKWLSNYDSNRNWNHLKLITIEPNILEDPEALEKLFDAESYTHKNGQTKSAVILVLDDPHVRMIDTNGDSVSEEYSEHFKFIMHLMAEVKSNKELRDDIEENQKGGMKLLEKNPFYKAIDEGKVYGIPKHSEPASKVSAYVKYNVGLDYKPYGILCKDWEKKWSQWQYSMEGFASICKQLKTSKVLSEDQTQFVIHGLFNFSRWDGQELVSGARSYSDNPNPKLGDHSKQFFKRIGKLLPEKRVDNDEQLEMLFSIKKSIKAIKKAMDDKTRTEDDKILSSKSAYRSFISEAVVPLLNQMQSCIPLTNSLEPYLHHMVTENVQVLESKEHAISLRLNETSKFRETQSLIELHTNLSLKDIEIDGESLVMRFKPSDEIGKSHEYRDGEFKLNCPCGCNNFTNVIYNRTSDFENSENEDEEDDD
jgi:hypothetical protein